MRNLKQEHKDMFFVIFFVLIFLPVEAFASVASEVNKANELYKHGRFDDSLKLYQAALGQDHQSPVVNYDLGTALYKKGDYVKALGYLEQAAEDKNLKIRPKAEYNIANTFYKSGAQKENTDVDAAIKSMQEALGHYGQTLAVEPKDQDALFNEDFVKKEIERLKKIKRQQQRRQNQQRQNRKQQQNQQKQQQQGQQSQQKKENQQAQQKNQRKKAQAAAQESQKELDRQEAEDLLEEYQDNEEPKKLLNYMPKKIDDRPVLKDW